MHLTVAIDAMFRDLARGDQRAMMLTREAAIADTVEWILRREDRIVVHAHDGHVQRCPGSLPGISGATTMGTHLADRLGSDYVAIGTTSATGQTLSDGPDFLAGRLFAEMASPEPGSLDALMAASHDGPFAVDLRTLPPDDTARVQAASRQRFGSNYSEQNALDAFDVVIHLPRVTAAELDAAAVAASPADVQKAFATRR